MIFPADFRGMGTQSAIRKALSRLTQTGTLKRAARGIYYIPKIDPLLGELHPGAEEISTAVAKKEGVRIGPTGAEALNRLGLCTQVPMRVVYLTDGPPRTIKIGKLEVRFKATSHKKLAMVGQISALVILALDEWDVKYIDATRAARIKDLLSMEDPIKLKHDLALASVRVRDYVVRLLREGAS